MLIIVHVRTRGSIKINILGDPDSQPLEVKLLNVESKVPIIEEQLVSLDNSFSRQLNTISNRIADTEQQLGELQEKIHL